MSFSSFQQLFLAVYWYYLLICIGSTDAIIAWRGNWAFGCDFPGNDILQVRLRGEGCGSRCASTYGCTHFSWFPTHGGLCTLKRGHISKSKAVETADRSAVCGVSLDYSEDEKKVIRWTDNWAFGCDFPGNDISSVKLSGDKCGPKCLITPECTHFAWFPTDDGAGVCWLKKGKVTKFQAVSVTDMGRVCGIIEDWERSQVTMPPQSGTSTTREEQNSIGSRTTKGESGSDHSKLNAACSAASKLNEYLAEMKSDSEKMKYHAESIKQQMISANNFRSSIEALTTILQEQGAKAPCDYETPTVKQNYTSIPTFDFLPPTNVWNPWRSASCTRIMPTPGQMTIVMEQKEPLPFELHLSVSNDPDDTTYAIHLSLDETHVKLSKTVHGILKIINQTIEHDYVLQTGTKVERYWLSIDHVNLFVKYGHGEVRDRCTLLKSDISVQEKNLARKIQFIHISFKGSRILSHYIGFENKIKLKIGQHPVVFDPSLLVSEPKDTTIDRFLERLVIPLHRLDEPCRLLYNDIVGWKFQDESFPHLFEAIERSVRSESGWCHKKLQEKASGFGVYNPNGTYLRITIGSNIGKSPGAPHVLEIWPPGHYSPIHAHGNTYGIIKVLYGEVNVKIYSALRLGKQKPIHEVTITADQVTWLSPGLNQIHKLENLSTEKSCITLQAYEYITSDAVSHYEYFDYINNNGLAINRFDPLSDLDYIEFRKIMISEWNKSN